MAAYTVEPNSRAVSLTMNREGIRTFRQSRNSKLIHRNINLLLPKKNFKKAIEEIRNTVICKAYHVIQRKRANHCGNLLIDIKILLGIRSIRIYMAELVISVNYIILLGIAPVSYCGGYSFIFDYEITLLTVRHKDGITLPNVLKPIGHEQVDGDYINSWQPLTTNEG